MTDRSSRLIELAEWQTRQAPVDQLSAQDRQLADALRNSDGGRLIVDERHDGVWITSRSWIGVVRFSGFEVRIVPKLAGGNVGVVRMLTYASGVGALRRVDADRRLDAVGHDLLEMIAWLFADACGQLVSDGLLSDYVAREDTLHKLRGRLRLMPQVQRQFGRVDPLEVSFDEFETDIPENQIIAAALDATRSVVRIPLVQRSVRRNHAIFHEACDPTGADALGLLGEIAYTRRNQHYETAHELAELLLRRLAVRDLFTPGGTTSFAFLLDMNELFEAFISRLVTDTLEPIGIRVHSQRRDRLRVINEATQRSYSAIIPDLLLEADYQATAVRLPVDAKYKLYDDKKIQESDIYQTFFYAFAYAAEVGSGLARAVILYPRGNDGSDTSVRVDTQAGRHIARIQAFGVDIAAALAAIDRGAVSVRDVPALGHLVGAFRQTVIDTAEESWLASSA